MAHWCFGLLLATCIALTTEAAHNHHVDWFTAETAKRSIPMTGLNQDDSLRISKRQTPYKSGFCLIRHWSSKQYVHVQRHLTNPSDDSTLVFHSGHSHHEHMSFRFVQVTGHYGYLEHKSGKIIHPFGGALKPADDRKVVLHMHRHAAALFTIDQKENLIIHRSGKLLQSERERAEPKDNTPVVLHHHRNDASRFECVDPSTLKPISIFPKPALSGHWKMINVVINPMVNYVYELTYTVGKSVTKSASHWYEWKVEDKAAALWFQADARFQMFTQASAENTWETAMTRQMTIKVSPGQNVVTWQYFFEAEQFGDGLQFRSTLLADTDDVNKQPNVTLVQFKP